MYSNFITPPDFVNEDKHTVTVIDATETDIELLTKIAKVTNEDYNIYLYNSNMQDLEWLSTAMDRSDSVIVNLDIFSDLNICNNSKTYYYGQKILLSPAQKVISVAHYFYQRQNFENK